MKAMKKYLMLLVMMALCTIAFACSSSNDETEAPQETFSVSAQSLKFPSAGGSESLLVSANKGSVACTSGYSWLKVERVSQGVGKAGFNVVCDANTAYESRTAEIKVSVDGVVKATVNVEQEAASKPVVTETGLPGVGWNLGNQMDAHNNGVAGETAWGNPQATQATFDAVKKAGFTSVRIPVTWMGHVGKAPEYKIEEAWLNRVAELVGYAEKAGLKAIVNIHHDGGDSKYWLDIVNAAKSESKNTEVKAQLKAMWTQIAEKFKNTGDFLMFESMNEIQDGKWGWGANRTDGGKQYKVLNEWQQTFVDAVRAVGGKNSDRWLGVCGYSANPDLTMENLKIPDDNTKGRLMVSVHDYGPTEYTLECKYSEWGHTGAADKKAPGNVNEDYFKNLFQKLKTTFVDKGYPVYIGETGNCYRGDARAELFRKYFLEYVAKAARTYGLSVILWDNGTKNAGRECHGYFDHATGAYLNNAEEMVKAFVKGYTDNSTGYTLQSVYDNAPK